MFNNVYWVSRSTSWSFNLSDPVYIFFLGYYLLMHYCYFVIFSKLLNFLLFSSIQMLHTALISGFNNSLNNLNYKQLSTDISHTLTLFQTFSSVCLVSNDFEITDFINNFMSWNKTVVMQNFSHNFQECDCIVVIETENDKTCPNLTLFNSKHFIYIMGTATNIEHFSDCVSSSWSPEVVFVSIENGSVFQLSSTYQTLRSFAPSSVAAVLARRHSLDLGGRHINAATMHSPPLTIFNDLDKPEEFDGVEVILFQELSQHLNFTLKYLHYKNWGEMDEKGTWIGGIGLAIQQGTADIVIANLWQIPFIYHLVDFGPSLNRAKATFLVRRPMKTHFRWKSLARILEIQVWLAVVASFLLVTLIYAVCSHRIKESLVENLSRSFLTVLGFLTMTSAHSRSSSEATRFVLAGWSMFSVQLVMFLSSDIASRLTLPQYKARMDTLQQLVEGGYYWTVQYYARYNSTEYKQTFFDLESHWDHLFEKQYRYWNEEEVNSRAAIEENITFLVQTYGDDFVIINTLGLIGHQALRDFRLSKAVIVKKHVTFGVQKKSMLLEPLSIMTLRFQEAGLPRQWLDQVIHRWPLYDTHHLCVEHDTSAFSEPQPLLLDNLCAFFIMHLIGLSGAFILFLTEVFLPFLF